MNKKYAIAVIVIIAVLVIVYGVFQYNSGNVSERAVSPMGVQNEDQNEAMGVFETATSAAPAVSTVVATPPLPEANSKKDVQFSFEQYQKAILSKNSILAVKYVNQETVNYYDEILSLIKTGDKTNIQNKRLVDQLMVLIVRHGFGKSTILAIKDGRGLISHAIDNGMIGEQSVSRISVNSVRVEGNNAFVEVKDSKGNVSPLKFTLNFEQGVWKINLVSLLPAADIAFSAGAKESGMTEEEFIFQMLTSLSGTKPTQDVWKPLI